jgi:hypothetical protein
MTQWVLQWYSGLAGGAGGEPGPRNQGGL